MAIPPTKRKNIVVLGAGFGGITALLSLHRRLKRRDLGRRYQLVLVSKNAQHLYTPALYEIAAIPPGEASAVCLKSAVCIQVEDIIAPFPRIRFIAEEVCALDPRRRLITFTQGGKLNFSYAIVALGSETNFYAIPGLAEHAYPLKTFADAVRLRNRAAELAAHTPGELHIIIGGAGATGVETAAELRNLLRSLRNGVGGRAGHAKIILVEAAAEILPGFNTAIVAYARQRLKTLGIEIRTETSIAGVSPTEIRTRDGHTIPYHLFIWSGGIQPAAAIKNFGLPLDERGRIMVNEFLEAHPRIFAVGDCASFIHPKTKKSLPANVPVAEAEARLAAQNIVEQISGGERRSFRPLKSYPYILAVGGKYALTDLIIFKGFGFLGWFLKQLAELRYLLFILPWRKAIKMWLRSVYYTTAND